MRERRNETQDGGRERKKSRRKGKKAEWMDSIPGKEQKI